MSDISKIKLPNDFEYDIKDAKAVRQSDVSSAYSATGTAPVNGTAVKASMTGTLDSTDSNHSATSKAVADSQAEQDEEIAVIANAGAKSLLPIGVSSITYANAVTFSVASDGTITVNGTNPNGYTEMLYADLVEAKSSQLETRYTLPAGKYKITSTGDGLKFQVHCHDGTNAYALFSGKSGGEFEYTGVLKTQYPYICWRLVIDAHASFSNQIVKPMIWNAEIKDSTFVPYAKTNVELTGENASQQSEINYAVNAGAKSLLPIGVSSITYANAVTFSIAHDGVITVNGTNPNGYAGIPYADLVEAKSSQTETRYTLPAGKYRITSTGDGLKFQVHCHDGTDAYPLFSSKSGGEFEYTSALKAQYPYICWRLTIDAHASFSNQIVKPMIWNAEIKDSTFQPYAPTNRELYEMILTASAAKFITKILAVDASQLNWATEDRLGTVYCSNFNTLYGSTISGWFSQVLSVQLGNYTSSLTPSGDFIIPVARTTNAGAYQQSNMIALWRMGTSTTKYTAGTIYLYIFGIAHGYDSI